MKVVRSLIYHLSVGHYCAPPPPPKPTPEDVRRQQLETTEFDLLEHQRLSEYHQAMVQMLIQRRQRLQGTPPVEDPGIRVVHRGGQGSSR